MLINYFFETLSGGLVFTLCGSLYRYNGTPRSTLLDTSHWLDGRIPDFSMFHSCRLRCRLSYSKVFVVLQVYDALYLYYNVF